MQTRCEVVERKTTIVESHYGSFSFFFFFYSFLGEGEIVGEL